MPGCDCGEALKPDVVLFGELLDRRPMACAERLVLEADLMLCMGSSLEVAPVSGLPPLTLGAGGRVAIVTQGRPPTTSGRRSSSQATWWPS